jgi:hypothetical protein
VGIAGFCGGLTVILEKKNRRIELALYCLSQAVLSFYNCWHKWGFIPHIPNGNMLVFAASCAVIFHSYVNSPHSLRPAYLYCFQYLFPQFRSTRNAKRVNNGNNNSQTSSVSAAAIADGAGDGDDDDEKNQEEISASE